VGIAPCARRRHARVVVVVVVVVVVGGVPHAHTHSTNTTLNGTPFIVLKTRTELFV